MTNEQSVCIFHESFREKVVVRNKENNISAFKERLGTTLRVMLQLSFSNNCVSVCYEKKGAKDTNYNEVRAEMK